MKNPAPTPTKRGPSGLIAVSATLVVLILLLGPLSGPISSCTSGNDRTAEQADQPKRKRSTRHTTTTSTSSDGSTSSPSDRTGDVPKLTRSDDPTVETNPDGVPIAEAMPFKGMSSKFIDSTWLGPHDRVDEIVSGGTKKGATPYCWLSQNGHDDLIFIAYVRGGEVIEVSKMNMGTDYWQTPGKLLTNDYPDRTAKGLPVSTRSTNPDLPDPEDYASAEEFADNAIDYYEWLGVDDPYGAALDYWDLNAP